MNNIPYGITIYLEIFMNKEITHTSDTAPVDLGMCRCEGGREHPCSLTNNLNVFDNTIITKDILFEFFFG